MKGLKSLILLFVFPMMSLFSQDLTNRQIHLVDSLKSKLKADSTQIFRFQKYRPYVNFDQRYSFIKDAPINVNGLQFGTLINDKHVIGIGVYSITAQAQQKVKTKTDKNIEANRELSLKYATVFYQYVAIDKRYIELDLQAELGVGKYDVKLTDAVTNKQLFDHSSGMLVTGVGPLLAIKPFKWIGIIGMAGYRLTAEKGTNLNFSGAYYAYGVWLDVRQIIRDVNYYWVKKPKYNKQLKSVLANP